MLNTNSLKLLAGSPTYRSKLKMEKERVTMNNFRKFTSDFDKTYLNVKELNKRYAIFKMNMKTAAMLQYKEKGMIYHTSFETHQISERIFVL